MKGRQKGCRVQAARKVEMSELRFEEYNMITKERRELVRERIVGILGENPVHEPYRAYFDKVAEFLQKVFWIAEEVEAGKYRSKAETVLACENKELYADILPEAYGSSYANPAYAVKCFGEKEGRYLSFLYTELRAAMVRVFEGRFFDLTVTAELFVEIYNLYEDAYRSGEPGEEEKMSLLSCMEEAVYYYAHDYSEIYLELRALEAYDSTYDFAYDIIMNADLSNPKYLYYYGEYISENEKKIAEYLATFSDEEVQAMADTYTEGYIRGFVTMGADLSIKSTVLLRYPIGFERMMRCAIRNFEAIGKKVTISRAPQDVITKFPGRRPGYTATLANPQFDYDHRYDCALFMDNRFKEHKLDCQKNAWEKMKEEMAVYAGPAVVETFGEPEFQPAAKPECCKLDAQQESLMNAYRNESGMLAMNYIKDEETSFTIIAYPLPSIGADFDAIFAETVKVNNLDNDEYKKIQQAIIDVLDAGETAVIRGRGENKTNLTVNLATLTAPDKQTRFENCTADVNIPVGEVFTSPKLTGTNGVLHVSSVYLNGLEYKNLMLEFKDGMIADYSCSNFDSEEENRRFVKENVLFNQPTLPLGEFAIGTNTTAYRMGQQFRIQSKLPILIAEKTGPHFAVGDTCYSRSEDHAVFNPDGKEIIARDNECSILRKTQPEKAYFNCHTDITIPYDEVGLIAAVKADGTEVPIIKDGKFVLTGTEKLNENL